MTQKKGGVDFSQIGGVDQIFFLYIRVVFTYTATLRDTDNQSPPAGTSHVLSFVIQRQNHLDADNIALESLSKA